MEKTVEQIEAEMAKLEAELKDARAKRKRDVRARIDAMLGDYLTIQELYPELFEEQIIKFRDPNNPDNTWGGIGKRPNWLREYVEAGRDVEEFRVRR